MRNRSSRSMQWMVLMILAVPVAWGGKTPAPIPPPSAMAVGSWTPTGPAPESFYFLPSQLSFQRSFTVPAGGAWLWGDARFRNFLEMDCDHHYRGDVSPGVPSYSPFFTAGLLPPPSDVCSFNNCYSCRLDWGGIKSRTYLTTVSAPAFVPEGSRVITISTLNGGGDLSANPDNLNLWIAQENRNDISSVTMFQSVTDDDPTPANDTDVAARYFIANSADRVPVVPTFHASNGDFPGGPGVTYTATWDDGSVTNGEESVALVTDGLTVVDVPLPKLPTGSHTFTLTAEFPGGKKLTTPSMTVFVYAQSIYVTYDAFDPKNPVDDLPKIVPGADINGTNVDLRNGPQLLQLNILIGRGSSGNFEVHLRNVSHYPGIAMNYPVGAASPDPDPDLDFGSGITDLVSVTIPKGGAPKVVKLPLYVHDYAATGTIEVTIPYKKKTFTAKRSFPLDEDGNGLPDAGWFVGTKQVSTTGMNAAGDTDEHATFTGQAGDGLSAFEEYRGFFMEGQYYRLDPDSRDLFLVPDASIMMIADTPIARLFTLGPSLHFLDTTDVDGEDYAGRGLTLMSPIIDPNRAGVPGARPDGQRGVRIIDQQQFYPSVQRTTYAGDVVSVPVYRAGIFGATIVDNEDVNSLTDVVGPQSPDGTQLVEWYEQTRVTTGVHTDFSSGFFGYVDANGQPTEPCLSPGNPANCDDFDLVHHLILPQQQGLGLWADLHTVPTYSGDFFTLPGQRCDFPGLIFDGGFTTDMLKSQRGAVIAHEVGHAVRLAHSSACGEMMSDRITDTAPLPTIFNSTEKQGVKLWQ